MAVKKTNVGDEKLLRKSEWVSEELIQGNDELVLNASIINKAQERILDQYKPTNNIALVSLCTATRPYSKSQKWKKFLQEIKGVDFIISSNGGVIPIQYESSYPYMTYDAHGESKFDELYQIYTIRNLIRFFILKRYDHIVFNFRPTLRNRKSGVLAGRYLQQRGYIKSYKVCPSRDIYAKAAKSFTYRYQLFPDIHPVILNDMKDTVLKLQT